MKRSYLLFLTFTLFVVNVSFAESHNKKMEKRKKISPRYEQLRAKAKEQKIRIIAKISTPRDRIKSLGASNHINRYNSNINAISQQGVHSKRNLKSLGLAVYEVDANELDALMDSGYVTVVEEDYEIKPFLADSLSYIGADYTATQGYNGAGQTIAVIDTGIKASLFDGKVVDGACFSSSAITLDPIQVTESICPNGSEQEFGVEAGADCTASGLPGWNHGTAVTGITHAIVPDTDIISVQVFSRITSAACPSGCLRGNGSDLLSALNWLIEHPQVENIAAVNMSLGFGTFVNACDNTLTANAIATLRDLGIASVVASGNNGQANQVSYPACVSDAITTSAIHDEDSTIYHGSNRSNLVDIFAPGENITSIGTQGEPLTASGTSFAAPHVAGAFAALRSQNPDLSVDDIELLIEDTGFTIIDPATNATYPVLDLATASATQDHNGSLERFINPTFAGRPIGYTEDGAYASHFKNGNTADAFCESQGYNNYWYYRTSEHTDESYYYFQNPQWHIINNGPSKHMENILCTNIPRIKTFSQPIKVSPRGHDHRLGDSNNNSSNIYNSAWAYCVENGFTTFNSVPNVISSYGWGHAWYQNDQWSYFGGTAVNLIESLSCTTRAN